MSQNKDSNRYRLRVLIAVTSLLLLAAAEVSAGDSRWYVETKLGQAKLDAQFGSRWPKTFDDDHGAAGVEVGYQLNRYLAFQAGYHDLGEYQGFGGPCPEDSDGCVATIAEPLAGSPGLAICIEGANDPICQPFPLLPVPLAAEVSGLSLAVVPRWPITERLSAYGKLGVIGWRNEVSGLLTLQRTERFSGDDLLAGVGVKYTFPKGFGVLAEYQRLDLDLGSTSLGTSWHF